MLLKDLILYFHVGVIAFIIAIFSSKNFDQKVKYLNQYDPVVYKVDSKDRKLSFNREVCLSEPRLKNIQLRRHIRNGKIINLNDVTYDLYPPMLSEQKKRNLFENVLKPYCYKIRVNVDIPTDFEDGMYFYIVNMYVDDEEAIHLPKIQFKIGNDENKSLHNEIISVNESVTVLKK